MTIHKRLSKVLIAGLMAGPSLAFADPLYSLTFLPQDFYAVGINNMGQVVGTAGGGAAIWSSPTSVTSLGSLLPGSEGLGINNRGDIVGRYGNNAFIYANGVATSIVTGMDSWATGINDAGQVTGTALNYNFGAPQTAFLYSGGATTLIGGDLPRFSQTFGNAINNAGVVAGTYAYGGPFADPDRTAFTYSNGVPRSYGTLGGTISEAEDINEAGALAGWSTNYEGTEELGLLYTAEYGLMNIGSLGGTSTRAHGLNNFGWVVGMSDIDGAEGFDYHAFLYREHGMLDLNSIVESPEGWRLVSAEDVNDAGQILAQACQMSTGDCRAVRLDLISAVPEPSSWLLMLGGLASLRQRHRLAALPALALLATPMMAQAGNQYAFTMTPVPTGFAASAINNAGHVVGTYQEAAAIWTGTGITSLGNLVPESLGLGINDRDHVVGTNGQAFIHTPAGVRNLGRFGFWLNSRAVAVNNADQVAGTGSWPVGEEFRGWVFSQGVLRMIGTFGGDFSEAYAINNAGQVVGLAALVAFRSPRGDHHAFLYRDRVLQDLGTLGDGVSSRANDINDAGQIVGASEYAYNPDTSGPIHPFLYQNRLMRDLGTLGGPNAEAYGINNAGAVVGYSDLADGMTAHAFLYENGKMRDLHRLTRMPQGWLLVGATDINDRRQVLARACLNEDCISVRLDPIPGTGG